MNNKLLTIRAAENVVRILPPLNVKKEELDQANKQFSDLLKGLGLAGVFALPGGLLAIAFIVKLGEKLGVDIIPEKYKK